MADYEMLYKKAKEIVDEMKYKGRWWIETEGYGALLCRPYREPIDLDC